MRRNVSRAETPLLKLLQSYKKQMVSPFASLSFFRKFKKINTVIIALQNQSERNFPSKNTRSSFPFCIFAVGFGFVPSPRHRW